ncbi:MAG: hypothetical protein K2O65_09260 [Lachnospiraceae bacterium]|nr:hypothetical protein [Lachnospiraceae bacterium]
MIYPKLCEVGLKGRNSAFVVTQRTQKDEKIDNIPVVEIDEIRIEKSDASILVCVSEVYRQEIVDIISMRDKIFYA